MAEVRLRATYSFRDYVALEEMANVRHEYLEGDIYAMAGGSPEHAALAVNLSSALHAAMRGKSCRVHSSDLRIRVADTGLVTYPDVTVVCGVPKLDPDDGMTVLNPTVVAEITSPSSAAYDRGEKLAQYRRIQQLKEIVIVAHDDVLVELFGRGDDGSWRRSTYRSGNTVPILSLGCELMIDELYRDDLDPSRSLARRRP